MRARCLVLLSLGVLASLCSGALVAQTAISADGNVETDAQLVSKVATGTPPLAVSSTTMVANLNADQVDGIEGTALALDADLTNVEAMLVTLQAQVDALGLALVPRTGQTTCYDASGTVVTCSSGVGEGQDGDLQLGVTWPNPRFTDNGDGTITDNLTGLVWLRDAECFGANNWTDALAAAVGLYDGCSDCGGTNNDCGLTDGSIAGAWRLPNMRELQSLVHYGVSTPAVPNTAGTGKWVEGDPFSSVQSEVYWSSTTSADLTGNAWAVVMTDGTVFDALKSGIALVWPVKGGQ